MVPFLSTSKIEMTRFTSGFWFSQATLKIQSGSRSPLPSSSIFLNLAQSFCISCQLNSLGKAEPMGLWNNFSEYNQKSNIITVYQSIFSIQIPQNQIEKYCYFQFNIFLVQYCDYFKLRTINLFYPFLSTLFMNIFLVEFDLQKQNNQQFNLETTNKVMPRRSTRSRRYVSDSQSESSYDDSGPKKTEDLYAQLKDALVHNDRYIQRTIRSISDDYKETVGVVRVTIPESFTFNQNDIEDFFRRFGRIQNIILKQNTNRLYEETNKNKEVDSIAYIIFSEYFSAVLAVKVINSAPEKERVVSAKICSTDQTIKQTKLGFQPSLNSYSTDNMVIEIQHDYEFGDIVKSFKYVGTIGMDITDKTFPIKSRIIGVKGANFVRIHFLCEKSFRFENQGEQSHLNDLDMRLIINKSQQIPRDVLVLSNCLQKYNKAMHYLHQLMEQIVEQYKNSKEKSIQIIPKDIHIRRWEKFNSEPQLKFLT